MFSKQSLFGGTPVRLASPLGQMPVPAPAEPRLRVESVRDPLRRPAGQDRTIRTVMRMCDVLRRLAARGIDPERAGRIFWSYATHARIPPDMAGRLVAAECPDIPIPPRPERPPRGARAAQEEFFRGRTQLSYEDALDLAQLLDVALAPLTPEEAAAIADTEECARNLVEAGGFPIVERLRERLNEFILAGDQAATFEISRGEAEVAEKAVECAVALGRTPVVELVATGAAAAGGGALLLLLLGVL